MNFGIATILALMTPFIAMMGLTINETDGGLGKLYEKTNSFVLDVLYLFTSEYTYAGAFVNVTALQQDVVATALMLLTMSRVAPVPIDVSA